jgi:hypothetical protein
MVRAKNVIPKTAETTLRGSRRDRQAMQTTGSITMPMI